MGAGTTFHIYLPASHKEIVGEGAAEKAPLTGKGRILIMDDEEIVREVAGEMLRSLGYEAEITRDGEETIALYQESQRSDHPFNAVILDLTIPGGMGGKEVIRRLHKIDPGVNAIVSSGYSSDPIMSRYGEYGFKGVVSKPYSIQELNKTLHEVLETVY
ncbi:response regulator receiver protein [bacterium BMS3Bbin06]|nr:response regulator receiver protein [bacterium BMS3Bbin06]